MPLTRVSYNFDCPVIMLFIWPESCATRRGRHWATLNKSRSWPCGAVTGLHRAAAEPGTNCKPQTEIESPR